MEHVPPAGKGVFPYALCGTNELGVLVALASMPGGADATIFVNLVGIDTYILLKIYLLLAFRESSKKSVKLI